MQDFIKGTALIFYKVDEKLQEKRGIECLISLYNAQELFIEDENSNAVNFHKASIDTLKFAISAAQGYIKTGFNTVFIKLLNIRLNRLIEIQEESAKRLRKLYENGELKWMDNPFNKLISEMNIGLLNNNLTRLKEGYYNKECNGLDNVWVAILEKELKAKKQTEAMKSKMWPSSDGPIHVEKMSGAHINNCMQRLENKTKKGSFEFNWLGIFYEELKRRRSIEETIKLQEAQRRQEIIRREEEKQRKIAFIAKVWESYKNGDLTLQIVGSKTVVVQELTVTQLNYGIKESKDDTIIAILREELKTRNAVCLDDYDNDKLYLYGRNVSYMNLINVSDGINVIKRNPERYLENLLECMKHREKTILSNHDNFKTIKAGLVDLSTWGLKRLRELYKEIKCSNDPTEKKLRDLYIEAIIAAEEKEEKKQIGDIMMKRYNAGELAFAYTTVDGKPGISYVQDMAFEDIVNAKLTVLEKDYNHTWKKIFDLEYEKRINANRQAEKAYNLAKRYGATPSTLEKINSEMYKKEFEEKFPDLQEFILFLKTFRM